MILDSRGTRAHARLAYHSRLALTHDLRHLSSIYPVGVRQRGVEFATFYYPGLIKCALRRFDIDPRTDWRAAMHGKLMDPTKIDLFKQRKRRIAKGGMKQTDSLGSRADVKKT